MSQGQGQGVQPQAKVPPQRVAQAAHVAPVFTLGPGQGNALLDYSNASHIKTYYKAVTPLEHKFDGKPSNLCIFMKSVTNWAKSFGWVNILNINDSHGNTQSLHNNYGQLTTAEVNCMHETNGQINTQGMLEMLKCCIISYLNPWMRAL